MKLNYLYAVYFLFGCLACLFVYFDFQTIAISFKWLGLLVISIIYFQNAVLNNVLFYLGIIFSGLGETFIVIDFFAFFKGINILLIIYWWLLILLLKNSVGDIEYKIKKDYIVPLIVSSALIIYITYTILDLVKLKIEQDLIYGYFYIASLLSLLFYVGVLYISKHNQRYTWLLFLLISLVGANILTSIDTMFFKNALMEQLGYFMQIATHFFLLKFLITKDEEVSYIY